MNQKTTIPFLFLLFTTSVFSQQIGDGFSSSITDFTLALKSGLYNGTNAVGKNPDVSSPWQHLFVVRNSTQENNYQLQLSSSFIPNDRLFFRKSGNTTETSNSLWYEIATRGANNFAGNQNITGTIKIQSSNSNYNENLRLLPSTINDYASIALGAITADSGTGTGQWNIMRYPAANNYMFSLKYNATNYFNILNNGNVGIGTINPLNKLDVNGTIHSKEVKVDMNGWSDFVFRKDYSLPTLQEVEKHIVEKGHLENIPSEEEVLKNGINLGEMNSKLLQKIEELTLYMIEIKKENKEMKSKQTELENTIKELKDNIK